MVDHHDASTFQLHRSEERVTVTQTEESLIYQKPPAWPRGATSHSFSMLVRSSIQYVWWATRWARQLPVLRQREPGSVLGRRREDFPGLTTAPTFSPDGVR